MEFKDLFCQSFSKKVRPLLGSHGFAPYQPAQCSLQLAWDLIVSNILIDHKFKMRLQDKS